MPNSNQTTAIQTYNTTDMVDAYSLAECDMRWMSVAISDIKKRLQELNNELGHKSIVGLYALEHTVDMYQYIAENRLNYYMGETEAYEAELNGHKKSCGGAA
ncbi:hypothetical protein [Acinetobacter sp. MD2]|uniref:hypothetical protein n=1 Tax=Acinetobacter sp. MD2 TaxID=2600066 RepID=UPI002D1E8D71|nr:hypothetical protein [Acinetobacter sp. MD2]MEB3766377.1 hypothetical protein [Acinetobacter sp. MD2]